MGMGIRQILTALVVVLGAVAPQPSGAKLLLEKVVLLSRHGVRAPTMSNDKLAEFTTRPWPTWPVPPGNLTPRGKHLATLMGAYYGALFRARGLLTADRCPSSDEIHLQADLDQRTILTGEALLDGLFPGCGLKPVSYSEGKIDPLFHPVEAGICSINPELAQNAVLGRIGGDFEAILDAY